MPGTRRRLSAERKSRSRFTITDRMHSVTSLRTMSHIGGLHRERALDGSISES